MKKVAVLAMILISGAVFAQEKNQEKKPERIKLVKIETTSTSTSSTQNKLTPEQEIANCRQHLEALDQKEAWIRQIPEETQIATENGWFEQAEATRIKLRARIKELEK